MATAGFSGDVDISANGSTFNALNGANSVTVTKGRTMLDITDFEDDAVNRLAGLKDSSVSLSGHYIYDDTAQAALETAEAAGSAIYVRYLFDGTNYVQVQGLVESFEISATPDGTVEFSCTVQATTAWTTGP